AQQQDWPAPVPIRESPPDRRKQELHRRKGGDDHSDDETMGAKVPAVDRDEGHDDPEPDQVNEDRKEDDQDGRLPHEPQPNNAPARPAGNLEDITGVYRRLHASQGDGEVPKCLGFWPVRPESGQRTVPVGWKRRKPCVWARPAMLASNL